MSQFCISCGAPLEGRQFCVRCGTAAPVAVVPQAQGEVVSVLGGPSTGTGQVSSVPGPTADVSGKPKRRWVALLIGGLLLLLGAFGGGTAFGWYAHRAWGPIPEPVTIERPQIAAPSFPAAVEADLESEVIAPDVRGLTPEDAAQALVDAGFNPDDVTIVEQPSVLPAGSVLSQQPLAGTEGPVPMTLTVSVAAKVPDLVGKPEAASLSALRELGIFVTVERRYVADATPGTALSTVPAAGEDAVDEMTVIIAAEPAGVALVEVSREGPCGVNTRVGVDGTIYATALTCRAVKKDPKETVWLLNKKVASLEATIGLDDKSKPGTDVRVVVSGDGQPLFDQIIKYGEPLPLAVGTAGVLRLTATVVTVDPEATETPLVVFGDALLTGSESDLASLETR